MALNLSAFTKTRTGGLNLSAFGKTLFEKEVPEARLIPTWTRPPATETEKRMQELGFVPLPKREPEPVFPEKEISLFKMLLTRPLNEVIQESIRRGKERDVELDFTIKRIERLPVSRQTKQKIISLGLFASQPGGITPFVENKLKEVEKEVPEARELVSALKFPEMGIPIGGMRFVSGKQAQDLIVRAVKSKLTKGDLQAITRGVMKDQAKMTAYKTMTTDPAMRKELSAIARNKKIPITKKIGDYLKETFKPAEPVKAPLRIGEAPPKVAPEALKAPVARVPAKPGIIPKELELLVPENVRKFLGEDIVSIKKSRGLRGDVEVDGYIATTKTGRSQFFTTTKDIPEKFLTKAEIRAIPKELEPLAKEARKYEPLMMTKTPEGQAFYQSFRSGTRKITEKPLTDFVKNPKLFEQYPFLKKTKVIFAPDKDFTRQSLKFGGGADFINNRILFRGRSGIGGRPDSLTYLHHEIEHLIDASKGLRYPRELPLIKRPQEIRAFERQIKSVVDAGGTDRDIVRLAEDIGKSVKGADKEFVERLIKIGKQRKDFYTQATKGVREVAEVAPEVAPEVIPTVIAPTELSGFKNFISKESSIGTLQSKINTINGKRLSGQITAEEANKSIQELRKEIKILADELGVAEIVKGTKTSPAIRKSGFFATKEIQTAPIRDVYNQTLHPHHMALRQDGYKLGGEFGVIFKKLWKPTEKAIRADKLFGVKTVKEIRALGEKHNIKADKKNLERLSDVIEGKIKGTPQDKAYIKELRTVLDDLREQANVVRRSMGKTEIGYIEDYIPHLQKTTLWNELLSNRATISDNLDFIVPNQTRNPFAFKRLFEELPKAERNLYVLLDRYVRAISKDIYITPAIENIKAYNNVIKNRELFNASRYWDDYIRQGLIGKQHRIDIAVGIGLKSRRVLQKWNNMVNLAFLTGKVAWNVATQPLSYIMNVPMETGVINSLKAIYKSFNKGLRQYVRENSNVLAIKSGDVRAVAIGEGRNIQNRIYRTKINKYNDMISMIGSIEERELTLASYIAGLDKAKQLGYKGEDAIWFADLTAARTQSMYNKENRALIINSDVMKMIFPFQSFAVEMFNHAKEIITKSSGAMQLTYRQRLGKLFGLIVGIYLSSIYSKAITGRKKTTVGTFVPFIGAYVDMLIARAMGEQYFGGRSPITVIQIGQDVIKGAKDFIDHGDLKKLRKVGLNFGLALGGIGGGGQINNIIDGIMANIDEDVKNVEGDVMFEVEDALSKVIAPFFGIWATKEGREYWETDEEPERKGGESMEKVLKDLGLPTLPGTIKALPKLPGLPELR